MSLLHPWLLVVAGAAAVAGLIRLLVPPRRRVTVAHLGLWRQALAQVGRQRIWRRPRPPLLLIGLGGLLLAAAAGGFILPADRPAPPSVLVLVADSVQLQATDLDGRGQKARLLGRLDRLFEELDGRTPVRLVVMGGSAGLHVERGAAGQWTRLRGDLAARLAGLGAPPRADQSIRIHRRSAETAVFLAGEFVDAPTDRPDVQWLFRPAPPGRDIGIVAAGAERTGAGVQVFAAVRRWAGPPPAKLALAIESPTGAGAPPATVPVELGGAESAGAVASLPADFRGPMRIRLTEPDDQPVNDVFYLAPTGREKIATVQLVGRPNEWIRKAIAASDRLVAWQAGQGRCDWLIVNEPADPIAAGPGSTGQGVVLIDPLVPPPGVRVLGELADVRLVSHRGEPPWDGLPLDAVQARRATKVLIDPRWVAVASNADNDPLIAYRPGTRQLAVFFSVAPDNSDWFGHVGWPVFWDALAELVAAGGSGRSARWGWRAGLPGLKAPDGQAAAPVARNHPEDVFEPGDAGAAGAINRAGIRRPTDSTRATALSLWRALAVAGAVLMVLGWVLTHRPRRG